jgi:hypothetical protein
MAYDYRTKLCHKCKSDKLSSTLKEISCSELFMNTQPARNSDNINKAFSDLIEIVAGLPLPVNERYVACSAYYRRKSVYVYATEIGYSRKKSELLNNKIEKLVLPYKDDILGQLN